MFRTGQSGNSLSIGNVSVTLVRIKLPLLIKLVEESAVYAHDILLRNFTAPCGPQKIAGCFLPNPVSDIANEFYILTGRGKHNGKFFIS